MAKEISKIIIKIEDDQSWDSMIDLSESKLVVIDCHQEWVNNYYNIKIFFFSVDVVMLCTQVLREFY